MFNDVQTLFSDLQQQGVGGSQGTLPSDSSNPSATGGSPIDTSAGGGSSGTTSAAEAGDSGTSAVGSSFGNDLKNILADLATIFGDLGLGSQTSADSSSASSTSNTDAASVSNSASSTAVGSLLDASA
ncbi:MAG TPA: hypothetical protein VHC22_16120 [Pirellulales bacterium]|nr:hypothetical protein [Pirellulales bacterium]